MKRTTYEAFALAIAVEQVLFEELGWLGALSLQDLGPLYKTYTTQHGLVKEKTDILLTRELETLNYNRSIIFRENSQNTQ